MKLPLVAHRLSVLAHVLIFRDGLDQAGVLVQHLLDCGRIGRRPVRSSRAIGYWRSCCWTIGPRRTLRRKLQPASWKTSFNIIIKLSYRQAYFLPLNLEVDFLSHQRGQDWILEVKHLAQEDLFHSINVSLHQTHISH